MAIKSFRSMVLTIGAVALLTADVQAQTRVAAVPIGPQPPVVNPTQMVLNSVTNKLYVVGDGGVVAVIDAATNHALTHISNTNGAQNGMFVNPAANKIYLLNGTLQVIDGATDTLVQTVQAPPIPNTISGSTFFGTGDYNPVTNRFYLSETYEDLNSVFRSELVVFDGATFAPLAILLGGPGTLPQYYPGRIVVNPTNNTIYGFYSQPNAATYYWLFDGASNTQVGGSSCGGTQCSFLIRGTPSNFVVNPADKMLWLTSSCTPPTTLAGGNGSAAPPNNPIQSCVTRLDGSLEPNGAYVPSTIVYGNFVGTGFDPASGRLVGLGNCLPATAFRQPLPRL